MTQLNPYLSNSGQSSSGNKILKDYQHASRLYVDANYVFSPKPGWIYFVSFNVNPDAVTDTAWADGDKGIQRTGLLVKKTDLPKYKITTETLNQYNRKTIVNTKLNYDPITMELHDDKSEITRNLWLNYSQSYFYDQRLKLSDVGGASDEYVTNSFSNTKFGVTDYQYGIYDNKRNNDFFRLINIYALHNQQFSQYTLINPKITDWQHDSLNQAEGGKVLQNRMTIAFETVMYAQGTIKADAEAASFIDLHYDNEFSPNKIAGNEQNVPNGQSQSLNEKQPGLGSVFGRIGERTGNVGSVPKFDDIMANSGVPSSSGFNLTKSVLGDNGVLPTPPGGAGINISKGFNTSVNGITQAAGKKLFGGGG